MGHGVAEELENPFLEYELDGVENVWNDENEIKPIARQEL